MSKKYCKNCGSKLGIDCGHAEKDFSKKYCSIGCSIEHLSNPQLKKAQWTFQGKFKSKLEAFEHWFNITTKICNYKIVQNKNEYELFILSKHNNK